MTFFVRSFSSPAPAPPDSPSDRAAKLREQGNEALLGMRHSDVLALCTQALAFVPDSVGLHYNLSRAHQFLGEYPEALTELEAFSKAATPEVAAKVGRLDDLFAQLRPRVSTLTLKCNVEGARVLLRDEVVGTTPLTPLTSLRVPAGAGTLQIELDGYFVERVRCRSLVVARSRWPFRSYCSHARRVTSIPLEASVPVTKKWWFCTGIAAVVVGGIVTAIALALTTEKSAGHGSLAPGQVSVP